MLKIISWNVNGIRAVGKKGFIDWLHAESPDILCVQETKALEEQVPEEIRSPQGYHSYFVSAERKGYSGVAMYFKKQPLKLCGGFGIEKFDVEGRVATAFYEDFVLLGIYFPNGGASIDRLNYKLEFYDAFLEHVQQLRKEGYKVIFCGDVNTAHKEIDLARPKENEDVSGFLPVEREWIDKLIASGFTDTFRMFNSEGGNYTWWDMKTWARARNVGWRLDYFFAAEEIKDQVKDAFILPDVMGSDHCPVGILLDV